MKGFPHIIFYLMALSFFRMENTQAQSERVGPNKITPYNARSYRDSLILKIFGTTSLPYNILPDSVITNVNTIDYFNGYPYTDITYPSGNLDSIDKLVITVDANNINFPTKSKVYLFHPHQSNGKLFIYHAGHCAGTAIGEDVYVNGSIGTQGQVIPQLIEQGYTVLAVPMIFYRNMPRIGYACGYNGHDQLFIDNQYAKPLALFFKPLIASLNLLGRSSYSEIYMMGLSGGGWVSSVYPAMDSAISVSIPVAGSWPMALRTLFYNGADQEQTYAPVFRNLLDYHELYTLSCLAPPRKMLQINNRYDACCYNGSFQHIYYVDSVTNALSGTGGLFRFYLDETQSHHAVAPRSMQVIRKFIGDELASLQTEPQDSTFSGMTYYYDAGHNFTIDPRLTPSPLTFSMLKYPEWMYMNLQTGEIHGQANGNNFVPKRDTVSFKVEDSLGRFLIKNVELIKKRTRPYFFTLSNDSTVLYFLPYYPNSIVAVDSGVVNDFSFNRTGIRVTNISILQRSIFKLTLDQSLHNTDSIRYNGMYGRFPLRYANNDRIENFGFTDIRFDAQSENYAIPGMIRFNAETRKFEYFNGVRWVDMH